MKEKIIKLLNDGLNYTQIGEVLGVHRTTIKKHITKYGIEIPTKDDKCVVCGKKTKYNRKRCDTCNTKIRRYRAKKLAVEYLGGICSECGFIGNLACFDIHHLDTNLKDFNPNAMALANKSWKVVKEELDKCILLCANCHRLEHNDYDNEMFLEIVNTINSDKIFK